LDGREDCEVRPDELAQLDSAFAAGAIIGDRYPASLMSLSPS
jgi:hypothetical protein